MPFELPLIFSNDNLYEFLNSLDGEKIDIWNEYSINKLFNKKIEETEPFNFLIYKNESSTRIISLIHPLSQLYMLKVIEKYDLEIINYFKQNAIFSLRHPNKISNKNINTNDTISKNLLSLLNEESDESEESSTVPTSYFIKRRFTKINDFFNSNFLKKLEIKYSQLLRIDFQNCFYNIYTHSLDWSYLGDIKLAKDFRNNMRISSILDKVLQASNYGETNGIVVGPEFSRYIAEIVLCNIDKIVHTELRNNKLINKIDYEIVRFMDDVFIFSNDEAHALYIKKVIEEASFRYRLSINESKSQLERRPFLRNNLWESKIRLKLINFSRTLNEYKGNNYKVVNNIIQELTDEIKTIIIKYPSEQHKIISFVLKFFENKIKIIVNDIEQKDLSIRKYMFFKLIDLFQYIIIFSINTSNILKYIKLSLFIYLSEKDKSEDITDLLYKKSLELLKYHSKKRIEVLNLFIFLKFIPKDLPESLLLRFLDEKDDYFTLATISYYLGTKERKYRYKRVRKLINLHIDNRVQGLLDEVLVNKNKIKTILLSRDFYLIYDFYSCEILCKETRDKIIKFKTMVDRINIDWSEKNLYNFFLYYLQGFDKPFMKWTADIKDIVEVLEKKSSQIDTGHSG
ncbi:hypothetical protein J2Y03_004797 [Neobacillus niacini]|uniref:RNA-directed DNA polymerase n=1 Tax=Neobacillus niacini TaxID=86668 RepID=UPI002861D9A5|nr:RNA-directed DNA polymerase [Neobacillus niacini]MDR7079739.1 hypothetical protein [Neobacillus niacini]